MSSFHCIIVIQCCTFFVPCVANDEPAEIPNGMDQDDRIMDQDPALKRKRGGGVKAEEDSDDEDSSQHAPRHDIYRSRHRRE